jgi:hypothetical protein
LFYSSCLMCCCASFTQRCCCCSTLLLLEIIILLFLFNVLCFSCSTCYSIPRTQRRCSSYSTLLFCSSCLTCYSTPLTWCCCSFCSTLPLLTHSSTSLLLPWFCCSLPLLLDVVIFVHLLSNWYSPFYFFASVEELSKFEFFRTNLEDELIFFNFCLFMSFFNYPCFWEMVVGNVFVCCAQELFGHCTFNYTHCISFAQLHCVFFITLHLFLKFLSITCKCFCWSSYSW